MNHRKGFNPLSRTTAHRRAMSRNMVTSLFRYERVTTTKAKALEVRKAAEKLITRAKVDNAHNKRLVARLVAQGMSEENAEKVVMVHNRRIAAKYIADEKVLNKLFTEIGPRMKGRDGGYTRILKMGFRQGDAADVVILELVDYKLPNPEEKEAKKAAKAEKKSAKNATVEAKSSKE